MSELPVQLSFSEITVDDIPALTEVMTRAFDDDAQRHLGIPSGGPDGYDDGSFFRKWLFGYEESFGYKVLDGSKIIGGFIVWIFAHGNNVLGTIFVDPNYQNLGVGTECWQFIEENYPHTKSWQLGTPRWAVKNHYYYETKCGFHRIPTPPNSEEFKYQKIMQPVIS